MHVNERVWRPVCADSSPNMLLSRATSTWLRWTTLEPCAAAAHLYNYLQNTGPSHAKHDNAVELMPKILNGSDSVRLVRIQTNMTCSDGIIGFGINYLH